MEIDIRKCKNEEITSIIFGDLGSYKLNIASKDILFVRKGSLESTEDVSCNYVNHKDIPNLIKALKKVCEIKNIDLS